MTLNEIGLKYQTDKSTITHQYLDNYARYFESLRNQEFNLLEIGVAGGASIKMWREYFPLAHIYGIDNNPDCGGEGIFIGDQNDYNFLTEVRNKIGPLHIVIDDGSHVGGDMINTFKFFFKEIVPKGYYIVEDTHCFYSSHYAGGADPAGFFSSLTKDVDVAGRGMTGNTEYAINHGMTDPPVPEYSPYLASMHIHPSLWIFERK